jgi:hypothetical protein
MPWPPLIEYIKEEFIEVLETQFILHPNTSSLDLLKDGDRFKQFKWHRNDYYDVPPGPNEDHAMAMVKALNSVRPERRPHIGSAAILTKRKFKPSINRYIVSQLDTVPDFPSTSGHTQPKGQKLNRHALKDFLLMREAALKEHVPIVIRHAYRTPQAAARNAERKGGTYAIAKFSAHILGLAIDVNLSYNIGSNSRKYSEVTTVPMQNVVDMRKSPIHKWLFLRGEQYGWYPYQHEPWHFEYNPPGFQERFFSELKKH